MLAVCSESKHHYLIAVTVQHTTDLSYKATSKIQNNNSQQHSNDNQTVINITTHCSRNKMLTANPDAQPTIVYQACALGNKKKVSCFVFCNLKIQLRFVKLRQNMFDLIYCLVILQGDVGLQHSYQNGKQYAQRFVG